MPPDANTHCKSMLWNEVKLEAPLKIAVTFGSTDDFSTHCDLSTVAFTVLYLSGLYPYFLSTLP